MSDSHVESHHVLAFPRSEYTQRLDRTLLVMKEHGIDTLAISDPGNINYLTAYDAWSFYVPQMVIVAASLPEPLWIGRPMDASGARVMTILSPDSVYDYPDSYVQSPDHHPMERVAEILAAHGLDGTTIGVELDNWYFTARSIETLRSRLPKATFADTTDLVKRLRAVKSPAEIHLMTEASQLTDHAMQVAVERIAPGVRQSEVAAAVWAALVGGAGPFGGDYPASMPHFPAGRDFAHSYHLSWSDALYGPGAAGIELSGVRSRYHCPLARTVFIGTPPARLLAAVEAIEDGMAAAFPLMRPGNTAADVEAAWRKVTQPRGFDKGARIGYSVGLAYPPTWGDCSLSLRASDQSMLEEDMTFHFIPSFMGDGWGIEISETVRVTPAGGRPFSSVPRVVVTR